MSGIKNLANAIANDPSFMSKIKGISKGELAQIVSAGKSSGSMKTPKSGKSAKY